MTTQTNPASTETHRGSCHCGAVRFEFDAEVQGGTRCNCTICTKTSSTNLQLKPHQFRLLTSEDALGRYGRDPSASRYFCKTCGVHCFGRGELEILGGKFVSVNLQAVDDVELSGLPVLHWDGRHDNWMAGAKPQPWPSLTPSKTAA